ncbi:MAG: hypothetical protein U0228_22080 [Myxococcaceae bacterium]
MDFIGGPGDNAVFLCPECADKSRGIDPANDVPGVEWIGECLEHFTEWHARVGSFVLADRVMAARTLGVQLVDLESQKEFVEVSRLVS